MLNQDMTGYNPGGRPTVFTDFVDSGLTAYVVLIAEEFSGLEASTSECGYGCSDHASARAAGFRMCFDVPRSWSSSHADHSFS